jgi:hypothetical protein
MGTRDVSDTKTLYLRGRIPDGGALATTLLPGLTAVGSALLTMLAMWGLEWAVKLENARVKVTEVVSSPGGVRERGVRGYDQGEHASQQVNAGSKPYRTLVIRAEIK